MSSIKTSYYTWLSAQASITSLLGASSAIYPDRIPQRSNKSFPALTYRVDNNEDIPLLSGQVSGLRFADIEVWCWATTSPAAEALADAVRAAHVGYSGTMGTNEVESVRKTFDDGDLEVDTELHFVRLVFVIPYR